MAGPGDLRDGVYDAFDCAPKVSDQRLTLEGNRVSFYESSCDLTNPQTLKNLEGAIVLDAACRGEGMDWTTKVILMQMPDGGILFMGEHWGNRYKRCY